MVAFALRVNGNERVVDAPGDTSLLEVLRDDLALTGAKYGCGEGQCGACTVLLDGEPAFACRVKLEEVGQRAITTIEGLRGGRIHDAFVAEHAMQCGYCTPGVVVAASALLAKNPDPSDAEIRTALRLHVCRCGAYNRIVRAVRRAAGAP